MEDRIRLRVVTPGGAVLERNVSYVRIPTPEGSLGVLYNHAPMLCALGEGTLLCRFDGGEQRVALRGGVARVEDNVLTVLSEEAETEQESGGS